MRRSVQLKRQVTYGDASQGNMMVTELSNINPNSNSNSNNRTSSQIPKSFAATHALAGGKDPSDVDNRKRSSFRKSFKNLSLLNASSANASGMLGESNSSSNFFNSTAASADIKSARLQRYTFVPRDATNTPKINSASTTSPATKTGNVELHVTHFTSARSVPNPRGAGMGSSIVNPLGTLRASLIRPKKLNALFTIQDGCLQFQVQMSKSSTANTTTSETWLYEVGNIEDLTYTAQGSSSSRGICDFSLMFYGDDKLLNIRLKDSQECETWVRAIFVEARKQASVFDDCISTLLPDDWKLALRTSDSDEFLGRGSEDAGEETADKTEHVKVKKFDERAMRKVETCLREKLDLIAFCRGDDHMECFEAQERLGKWLEYNGQLEDGQYWTNLAKLGYSKRQHSKANIKEKISALESVRNPKELEMVVQMRNMAVVPNMEERREQIMKILDSIVERQIKKDEFVEWL